MEIIIIIAVILNLIFLRFYISQYINREKYVFGINK